MCVCVCVSSILRLVVLGFPSPLGGGLLECAAPLGGGLLECAAPLGGGLIYLVQ